MDLRALGWSWERFARTDPLWAINTDPAKRGGGWDREAFFATGRRVIGELVAHLARLGVGSRRARALDFGCGVGRLTQALAEHYAHVTGVDIAPTMVRLARRFNRFGPRCRYLVNRRPHLGCLDGEAFDLVYTNITLQHMEPRLSLGYVREFLRLLAPGGVAVFQLPADGGAGAVHAVAAAPTTRERLEARVLGRAVAEQAVMEMYPVPQAVVTEILHANGARLVDVGEDGEGGEGFRSCRYTVVLAH